MPRKNTFSAVICELDPLHLGHRLLLQRAKRAGEPLCCVMSGNFVQRGAPAMLDKWARARLALQNGADLVIELPLSWACAGAERFAMGGVALASALGTGRLFFGSEVPDTPLLQDIAAALLSPEFTQALAGCPPDRGFAARRQLAIGRLLGPKAAAALSMPNANLGIEYCKAILAQNSPLTPVAIKRMGSGHNEPIDPGPDAAVDSKGPLSASEIRRRAYAGGDLSGLVPESTLECLLSYRQAGRLAHIRHLERAMLAALRGMEDFSRLPDISGGLEHRLRRAAGTARSLTELYALTKDRRVSHARVRRLALLAFLGVREPLMPLPPYLRVLGGTEAGLGLLKDTGLPAAVRSSQITGLSQAAGDVFRLEARAGDLYGLATPVPQPAGRDYTEGFIRP